MSQFAVQEFAQNQEVQRIYDLAKLPNSEVHDEAKKSMVVLRSSLNKVLEASRKVGNNQVKREQLATMYSKVSDLHSQIQINLPSIVVPARSLVQLAFSFAVGCKDKEQTKIEALRIRDQFSLIDARSLTSYQNDFSKVVNDAVCVMISAAGEGSESLQLLFDAIQATKVEFQEIKGHWDSEMIVNRQATQAKQFYELQASHAEMKVLFVSF